METEGTVKPKTITINTINDLLLGIGVSAGLVGMAGFFLKKQMEMKIMMNEGFTMKEVMQGIILTYNDLLKEKDMEIDQLHEEIRNKCIENSSLQNSLRRDETEIKELQDKIRELKSNKKTKKEGVKNAELQSPEDRPKSAE
jgi:predicted nuclease with TOPRIM domain